ncbi:hypothetical protein ACFLTM_00820 [Candidatus Bipolaricaulota bacterium]
MSLTLAVAADGALSLPDPDGHWSVPVDSVRLSRLPVVQGAIEIRGAGVLFFEPSEITAIRTDVFQSGQFSVFDVLVHLADEGLIDLAYAFDEELQTYVIESLNGLEGWWYDAHYEGGSFDRTVVRMDHFPVKDGMSIIVYLEDPERMAAIRGHFREEVTRRDANGGAVVVPTVTLRTSTDTLILENVQVSAHDVRSDVLQLGLVTMLDVLLSLGEQGLLDELGLEWRVEEETIEIVDGYYVVSIAAGEFSPEMTGACVLTHQIGGATIQDHLSPHTHTMSHIHLTADLEVLVSPESVEWLWVCL